MIKIWQRVNPSNQELFTKKMFLDSCLLIAWLQQGNLSIETFNINQLRSYARFESLVETIPASVQVGKTVTATLTRTTITKNGEESTVVNSSVVNSNSSVLNSSVVNSSIAHNPPYQSSQRLSVTSTSSMPINQINSQYTSIPLSQKSLAVNVPIIAGLKPETTSQPSVSMGINPLYQSNVTNFNPTDYSQPVIQNAPPSNFIPINTFTPSMPQTFTPSFTANNFNQSIPASNFSAQVNNVAFAAKQAPISNSPARFEGRLDNVNNSSAKFENNSPALGGSPLTVSQIPPVTEADRKSYAEHFATLLQTNDVSKLLTGTLQIVA
jgi:hypothetical protein